MNKAEQKSILRQLVKRCRRLGLGKFLRSRRKMFELYRLNEITKLTLGASERRECPI